jgi:hypothetical protein
VSLLQSETILCPHCETPVEYEAAFSVNADRRPDLRDGILNGTFQRETCPHCGDGIRMDPEMTYLDVGRRQWLLVKPAAAAAKWIELEREAQATFERSYGPKASRAAQAIGAGLLVRIAFGWAAAREKLLCAERGLDDTTLELVKLAVIRGLEGEPLRDDVEMRLVEVEGDDLVLALINPVSEKLHETLRVPRGLYDDIAADPDAWQALRHELSAGPFVDVNRLLVPAAA